MKKLAFCMGTRPEAIKMAPLILEAKKRGAQTFLISTGQHREMLTPFLRFFDIQPDVELDVMRPNQSLSQLTAQILSSIQVPLANFRPDWVFVQGDTTTTFASALAAFYEKLSIAHIEAGLRTYDRYSPFPEEMNRRLTTSLATAFFPPTETAKENLIRENVQGTIVVTGNTGIDGLRIATDRIEKGALNQIDRFQLPSDKKLVLVTVHRRENHGAPLKEICDAILQLAQQHTDLHFLIPVHLNPNVQQTVRELLGQQKGVTLVDPLEYTDFVPLMKNSWIILTDSGGVQEEAPYFKKPIFVMRESTERPEGIDAGVAELVGHSSVRIIQCVKRCLEEEGYYASFQKNANPYGDGHASERILDALKI